MSKDRKVYAPFSLTSELGGVTQTPVEGYIDVEQRIKPVLTVGSVNEKGVWAGIKSSDRQFIAFTKDIAIPNGAEFLTPSENADGTWPLDMTGFNDLFVAIKPTQSGDLRIDAVMGPDTLRFANLEPVNPAYSLRGTIPGDNAMRTLFLDATEAVIANVWNIFFIAGQLKEQKLLQFKITNNTGAEADIECAFLRVV
jgi:hypothetical protein